MLRWALGLLLIGLIAGLFGFGGLAAGGSTVARICFAVFLGGFSFAAGRRFWKRRRLPPRP